MIYSCSRLYGLSGLSGLSGLMKEDDMQKIADEILNMAVEGVNLRGRTFGEQFNDEATLLVFLRHLG